MPLLALFVLHSALAFAAVDAQTEFNRALAAQQQGDLASAITAYRHLLSMQPRLLPARINLGQALVDSNQYDDAAAQLQIAMQQSPDSVQVAVLLGNALILNRSYAAAVRALSRAQGKHPGDLDLRFLLGEALLHTPDMQRGLLLVLEVAHARQDVGAYVLAAVTQLRLLDFAGAHQSIDQALHLDRTVSGGYTLRGMASAGLNKPDEAKADFEQALAADPNELDAHLRLAMLLREDGDLARAKDHVSRALAIDPNSMAARYEDAKVAMAERRDADAVSELQSVTAAYPTSPKPHLDLAVIYFRLNRPDDGKREREIADRLRAAQNGTPDPLAGYDASRPNVAP